MTITCDKCGETFDAPGRRSKNCRGCSRLLAEAAAAEVYAAAREAFAAAVADGLVGAAVRAEVADAVAVAVAERKQQHHEAREAFLRRKEARRQRHRQNEFLARHGYRWWRAAADEESADAYAGWADSAVYAELTSWHLIAPDGRRVTVEQALAEIRSAAAGA